MSLLLLLTPQPAETGTFSTRARILSEPNNRARIITMSHNFDGAGIRSNIAFDTAVTEPVTVTLRPPSADTDGSDDLEIEATLVNALTPNVGDCALELIADGKTVYQIVWTGSVNGSWQLRAESSDTPPAVAEARELVKSSVFV